MAGAPGFAESATGAGSLLRCERQPATNVADVTATASSASRRPIFDESSLDIRDRLRRDDDRSQHTRGCRDSLRRELFRATAPPLGLIIATDVRKRAHLHRTAWLALMLGACKSSPAPAP